MILRWEQETRDGFGCRYRIQRLRVFGFVVYTRWQRIGRGP